MDMMRALFGALPGQQVDPRNESYPSDADADFARQQGYAYGKGWEPYFNKDAARFLQRSAMGHDLSEVTGLPTRYSETPPQPYDLDPDVNKFHNVFARAALAANRNPISTLGFDPDKVAMDLRATGTNYLGVYSPTTDKTYSALDPSLKSVGHDSVVHESLHRGLQHLINRNPEAATVYGALTNRVPEEYVVRYLMQHDMGDPEKGMGDFSDRERFRGMNMFSSGSDAPANRDLLSKLQDLAAQEIAKKTPMGPR